MSETSGNPAGAPSGGTGRTPLRLIPPEVLARLANLELVARSAVEGWLNGLHRTKAHGFSQEFAEYRDYVPGDDLRFIDWNAYARSDRPFIKRFEGDTNTPVVVMLDTSASMGAGDAEVTKLDYGRFLAASLVYLGTRQHDAVGLLTFHEAVADYHPPTTSRVRLAALYHLLDALQADAGTDWNAAFEHVASRVRKRGVVVVISDFYCDPEELGAALRKFGAIGHDLVLMHLLDPSERNPSFGSNVTLRDSETGHVMEIDPNDLASSYPDRLAAHERALRHESGTVGAHYVRMNTDEPLDRALLDYLRFRARRQ